MRRLFALTIALVVLFACGGGHDTAFGPADEAAFLQPPKDNYPETWFHFIGGNVSKEGIDADLEAIAGAGISGIHWFHGYFGGPWPATEHQLTTLSPEWEEMVSYLGRKADSLGLRLTIQTCPGWSMAGGPWISPEESMRMLVWSRTDIPAGSTALAPLPIGEPSSEEWRDYRDISVLAFPTPLGDTGEPLKPVVTEASDPQWKALLEGSLPGGLDIKAGSTARVAFTLPEGAVVRTLQLPPIGSISHAWVYDPGIKVRLTAETSDGEAVLVDAALPMGNWQDGSPADFEFACNEAFDVHRYVLTLTNAHPGHIEAIRLFSAARKNSWRGEAGWTLTGKELYQEHTEQDPRAFVQLENVLDLSDCLLADGTLDWTAPDGELPEGSWTVLRIGHVNSGRQNGPAPPEATGWECNKFDPAGAESQFTHYVGMLQDGPLGGLAGGMLMDSWECKTQTWTVGMEDEFADAAGYELSRRLPALMGYVIDSQEATSRFLTDWRRTVNFLYCENFFRRMTDLAHEKGMRVEYETAGSDVVTMDPLEYFKYADIPMCEFWQPFSEGYVGDLDFKPIRPTASAAHIYGKRRVDAESFTSFSLTWDEHWQMLREVASFNMAQGVTHNVFHTYTHNPQIGFLPPGTSFGNGIGSPFLRGQTWWKYMHEFTDCLARMSYMLERGLPVKDVLWYLGDEVGHKPSQYTGSGSRQSGDIRFPEGFDYDYCNPDVLINRLSVKDGRLFTPEGVSYSVLWIPENERMLPETVERLYELIYDGARVIAAPPVAPATLRPGVEERFRRAVESVWGNAGSGSISSLGKGQLAVGLSLDEALVAFGLQPHFVDGGAELSWCEREAPGARWFFIAPAPGRGFTGTVQLRGEGTPCWWDPVDGSIGSLEFVREGSMVQVALDLARAQSGFVVLRDEVSDSLKPAFPELSAENGIVPEGWKLSFPMGWGSPSGPVALERLVPWMDLPIGKEGRAFSGTATYEASFVVPEGQADADMVLDLGVVDMIAEVEVNGRPAGIVWCEPYRLPLEGLLKEGSNSLTVKVTSTWYNRLAYDASLPEQQRKTWTIAGPAPGSPLRPSGLMGPVVIH